MSRRPHPAWVVAAVAFVALVGAAGFRAAPGALMVPLQDEFGWSIGSMSFAVSINLVLYGVTAPFAAALMDRFGLRTIAAGALTLVALGSGLSIFATQSAHLVVTWGVLIGLGTGSMAMAFAATIANRWFVQRTGFVMGILTAGGAAGQLVFLPVVSYFAGVAGWRLASLVIAGAALAVVPLVLRHLTDRPEDRDLAPYGAPDDWTPPARPTGGAASRALSALRGASTVPAFWGLAAAFAICGATTNGLIGIHFIPSAHDHGMAETTAAGLLAVVGIFDIAGTIASGWLTDRVDPRLLLVGYYTFRGVGLVMLPALLSATVHPSMIAFIVVYGLDWVATVPPTVALCREIFGDAGTIVFGWVFAAHQIGAAVAAFAAGVVRDETGSYTIAWLGGSALCLVAAALSWVVGPAGTRAPRAEPAPAVH
ncbi:MFS transporter [Aeromicrobium sp. Leaf350]|uniref:MFS transporter n=1 Tax=Aeromicrobium sp. Leaf350 TaxID=2876565 RepID=UPI001E5223BD|nr:MFS transporter [Aeromicrobium sp. Leaf350]